MNAEDLAYAGLAEQAKLISSGELSSRELTEALLERIERIDPELNAFRIVLADEALAEADDRDKRRKEAETSPMLGVPVAIKDENAVEGTTTTFGTNAALKPAERDGATVRRLRAAGAVIIGKTNMPEFGQWPFTESETFGITRNPWDTSRTPGGSSGGTAAAVASGMVPAALGGDGGGSIRIPAASCGLFGLKPERGRLSADPWDQLWYSLGTTGPLTRRVLDSAIFYDAARGSEPSDRWRAPDPPTTFTEAARSAPGKLRIGISEKSAVLGVKPDSDQRAALDEIRAVLSRLGHSVGEAKLSYPDPTPAVVPQVYRGVHDEAIAMDRPELLESRTKVESRLGSLMPKQVVSAAMAYGRLIDRRANRVFADWDLVITPTIPGLPRKAGVLENAGYLKVSVRSIMSIPYTAIWNATGNPAASVPVGFSDSGLPRAVQIVGPHNGETEILKLAAQLESELGWHEHRPPLD